MRRLSFVLLLPVLAGLAGCAKSPEGVVEGFYRAVEKSELTEAKTYLSKHVHAMLGEAKMTSVLAKEAEKVKGCGGIASVKAELTGEGEMRSGSSTVTFKGECKPRTEKVRMIKEDGAWKITLGK